jgi:arylsulfatase
MGRKTLYFRTGIAAAALTGISVFSAQSKKQPNVILIIADDQGYGDLGFHGNPHVKTPNIDKLASQSIRFTNFYVSPVSAPTRSSLMTGRYSLRTGVRDTNNGGAMMASSEITIAEMLKSEGYRTGHFGKWHLGDNYPMRPVDQGFDESVMHLGGGMGQPGDFTTWLRGDSCYFNPVLWHNGLQESYPGYCSDIFTEEAIKFIENCKNNPFFCYLAFNAPHTPLQVPGYYYEMYRNIDPSSGFNNDLKPFPAMTEKDKEDARRVYAMVTNIDDNIGRLLRRIEELQIADNTVVIFMTDNGPQQRRYVAGMRGLKGSVYRGGVRVPFFIRYPAIGKSNTEINATSAHFDVLPTIAALCNAGLPSGRIIDGKNLLPFITDGEKQTGGRSLFFYWTRHSPELYNNIALQKGKYRLIGNTDHNAPAAGFELFDIENDPYERKNIVNVLPDLASEMKTELDSMFKELVSSGNMVNRPYIYAGTENENPVFLNRNDAGGQWGVWEQEEAYGTWRVVFREGMYNFKFRFIRAVPKGGRMMVESGTFISQAVNEKEGIDVIEMSNIYVPAIDCEFTPFYLAGGKRILPLWVEIEKVR